MNHGITGLHQRERVKSRTVQLSNFPQLEGSSSNVSISFKLHGCCCSRSRRREYHYQAFFDRYQGIRPRLIYSRLLPVHKICVFMLLLQWSFPPRYIVIAAAIEKVNHCVLLLVGCALIPHCCEVRGACGIDHQSRDYDAVLMRFAARAYRRRANSVLLN